MIRETGDPVYCAKFFDVLKWFRELGSQRFPRIATAAAFVLAKPFHNGFQERVFSTGTYRDSNLKRRQKENTFELTVLDSLNSKKLTDLAFEMKELQIYRENQKYD